YYRQATVVAPENAEALANLGGLLTAMRRYDEAIPTLLHAMTRDPRVLDGAPAIQLAQAYRRQGRSLEAAVPEARYPRLRRLKGNGGASLPLLRRSGPPDEYSQLGETALARQESWIALCAFRRGARRAPGDPAMWRGLARAQRQLGRFDDAVESMRRAHLLSR